MLPLKPCNRQHSVQLRQLTHIVSPQILHEYCLMTSQLTMPVVKVASYSYPCHILVHEASEASIEVSTTLYTLVYIGQLL